MKFAELERVPQSGCLSLGAPPARRPTTQRAASSEGRVLAELGVDESGRSWRGAENIREGCNCSVSRVMCEFPYLPRRSRPPRKSCVGPARFVTFRGSGPPGRTALMWAARCGQRDCLEALLQAGADKARARLWKTPSLSCRALASHPAAVFVRLTKEPCPLLVCTGF